jgi:hypothetical protein
VAEEDRAKRAEAARRAEAAEREAEDRRRRAGRADAVSGLKTLLLVVTLRPLDMTFIFSQQSK